jgi:hypothetical protein
MLTLTIAGSQAPRTGRKVNEWRDGNGVIVANAFSRENLHWINWRGLGIFAFSDGSREVRFWPDREVQPDSVLDMFSRVLQPIILQGLGWQVLHAGGTIGPAGGVLAFCGKKGSGKSTLAFAIQQGGRGRQFADDALVLRFDRGCVMACPLPFSPRLRPTSRAHFADEGGPMDSAPVPQPQLAALPLAVVFLLRQDARLTGPRVSLMQRAHAFRTLLAHAYCFDAQGARHTRQLVDNYLELVSRVPVFTLKYPPDLRQLPQLITVIRETAMTLAPNAEAAIELRDVASAP